MEESVEVKDCIGSCRILVAGERKATSKHFLLAIFLYYYICMEIVPPNFLLPFTFTFYAYIHILSDTFSLSPPLTTYHFLFYLSSFLFFLFLLLFLPLSPWISSSLALPLSLSRTFQHAFSFDVSFSILTFPGFFMFDSRELVSLNVTYSAYIQSEPHMLAKESIQRDLEKENMYRNNSREVFLRLFPKVLD